MWAPTVAAGVLTNLFINMKSRGRPRPLLHSVLTLPIGIIVGSALATAFSLSFIAVESRFSLPVSVNMLFPPLPVAIVGGSLAGLIVACWNMLADGMTWGVNVPFGPRLVVPKNVPPAMATVRRSRIPFGGYVRVKPRTPLEQILRLHPIHLANMPADSRRANLSFLITGAVMLAGGLLPLAQPVLPVPVGWVFYAITAASLAYTAHILWKLWRERKRGC
jgi:hypothetical protein